MTIGKKDLADYLAATQDLSKTKANEIVDGIFARIASELESGESVQIHGFGAFKVGSRAAREGRNPKTGETLQIAASKNVKFDASKTLKDRINGK